MNVPRLLLGMASLGLLATACASAPGDVRSSPAPLSTGSAVTTTPQPGRSASPPSPIPSSPSASASGSPHGDSRFGAADFNYEDLGQFVRQGTEGVALVRVESVSPLRWNTPDGSRPPEAALHAAWAQGTPDFFIGRAYQVRLERLVWGKWLATGDTDVYWLAGGKLGNDEVGAGSVDPPPPPAGKLGLALLGRGVFGTGVSPTVSRVFPVDASGVVTTMNPKEHVTLADLNQHLP